eukprot:7713744-Alexandrium_andersonii.AAC.1
MHDHHTLCGSGRAPLPGELRPLSSRTLPVPAACRAPPLGAPAAGPCRTPLGRGPRACCRPRAGRQAAGSVPAGSRGPPARVTSRIVAGPVPA